MDGAPLEQPIPPVKIDHLALMIGYVDIGWLIGKQGFYGRKQCFYSSPFQGRDYLKGEQGFLCLMKNINDFHGFIIQSPG
jgi:hypothetical protein